MLEMKVVKERNAKNPIVCGFFKNQKTVDIEKSVNTQIAKLLEQGFVNDELGAVTKIPVNESYQIVYLVCLGEEPYDYPSLLKAVRGIRFKLGKELTILLDSFIQTLDPKKATKMFVETVGFYNYKYDELKSKKIDNDLSIDLYTKNRIEAVVEESMVLVEATNHARDLVNKPYNYMSAIDIANYAHNLLNDFKDAPVEAKIYTKQEIQSLKMGAFLAVNQGSNCEPRLIHLKYRGNTNNDEIIALIGKGVMFDTGGYSIKTSMNTMKCDMAGAATVLGVFEAVVKNNVAINIDLIIAATDNRINGEAYLPDDVITAMNGKTIEIVSTDAEGRLTLADAITYAQQQGAKQLIDFATLTGAVVVALGDYITGLFGNDQPSIEQMLQTSKETYEGMWQLPITERIREQVRGSKVADITNSTGRSAGASGAAAFLEEFVEEGTKWMHLDIAGTAFLTSPAYNEFYGATGAALKTTYEYLKKKVK
jgi:leucyl aminopeptidase